jgi:hypothetical protein
MVLCNLTGETAISVIIRQALRVLRKPLLFLFVLAVGASLMGGGRLSLRLLVDTATALAPVPIFQVLALAIVFWTGRRRVSFGPAVEAFFDGSAPWCAAIAVVGLYGAFASPVLASRWLIRLAITAFVAAIVMSIRLDFLFFRDVLGRTRGRAISDLIVQRVVAWSGTLTCVLLMSFPKLSSFIPNVATALFGARPS